MKSYEQLLPKFSNEPGLVYRDMFVYPNNSVYRGQMKRRDESTQKQMKISGGDNTHNTSNMSQRVSAGGGTRLSENGVGGANGTATEDENIMEVRHGYGIQYWTDGAHYEGEWYMNKAEG